MIEIGKHWKICFTCVDGTDRKGGNSLTGGSCNRSPNATMKTPPYAEFFYKLKKNYTFVIFLDFLQSSKHFEQQDIANHRNFINDENFTVFQQ